MRRSETNNRKQRRTEYSRSNINKIGWRHEKMGNFKYLQSKTDKNGQIQEEITERLKESSKYFQCMHDVQRNQINNGDGECGKIWVEKK